MVSKEVIVPWSEVREEDISMGLTIGFVDLKELDEFVDALGNRLRPSLDKEYPVYKGNVVGGPLSKFLLRHRTNKSIGSLKDPRVTIMSTDLSFVANAARVDAETAVSFLAQADLYASGKGLVATVQRLCTISLREGLRGQTTDQRHYIVMTSKAIKDWRVETAVTQLNDESRRIWASVKRTGLMNAFRG